uniref:1-deoxy-D-xylulose 5-phosphate reductoisomerase n=1 Tax=Psychrobacter sp. (strain PRwf-1) TaxID=349106 RepID=DXR_PSYWF|nr:RecName: Full=1-deoxy-D-xylulose 5-phosphate reductoisomerase; Short=DXP reductoisomerase; AltName: Full=1-deoxyxylulose-5-phosphate reductoisomerase; AltName: Full=2-C-methyl-D-erythritol 4-phosphate synthase [Psychrobacter sp. PRwf-1]
MTQRIAVLGATGSIGDSTLSILAAHPEHYQVYALSGHGRLDKLFELCQQFRPSRVAVPENKVDDFATRLAAAQIACEVVGGQAGLDDIALDPQVDTVVAAIVGAAGLASTLSAAKAGKRVLLANKEALVMAGSLMMQAVRDNGATLLPLDSEHNAIFQCLPPQIQQNNTAIHDASHGVKKLWLTASGGPFLNKTWEQMQAASVSEAVKHPNWSMGQKISVDSATMMNKGLELIEACHLFDLAESQINVVIHPQSIIHSLVEYCDGSFLAQMGSPDMRTPIAHALAYPNRISAGVESLDLYQLSSLEFIKPDLKKFACLKLAREAMQSGQAASITLNAANEVAVEAFIKQQVSLTDIALINAQVLDKMLGKDKSVAGHAAISVRQITELNDILMIDKIAREQAQLEVMACRN